MPANVAVHFTLGSAPTVTSTGHSNRGRTDTQVGVEESLAGQERTRYREACGTARTARGPNPGLAVQCLGSQWQINPERRPTAGCFVRADRAVVRRNDG